MTITEFMATKTTATLRTIRDNVKMDSEARQAARLEILNRVIARSAA
jgi:hypothetical protein